MSQPLQCGQCTWLQIDVAGNPRCMMRLSPQTKCPQFSPFVEAFTSYLEKHPYLEPTAGME